MPPRFSMEPPAPAPVPAFVPPTGVPEQGPTFGGSAPSTAPQVGVGRPSTTQSWRRPAGGGLAADMMGIRDDPRTTTRQGFETQPADRVLNGLFDMPKPELRALQMQMYDAGFYGNVSKDAVVFGAVDDATWGAFGDLLEMAVSYNTAGREVTWFEVLDEVQRLRKEQGTNLLDNQGPKRAPFRAEVTSSEDIERTAQYVATQLVGENVDPGLVRQIIAQFQGAQVASQRAMYDTAETGGTAEAAPSLETFAANAIENADPVGAQAYAVADRVANDFQALLSGPFAQG